MNLIQTFRRLGQQLSGWSTAIDRQYYQLPLVEKLYTRNGLEIRLTCNACPEQYEVFKDNEQVAYYRLRHGEFRVDVPNCGGETIFEADTSGDGIFDNNERLNYLAKALREVLEYLKNEEKTS